MKYFLSSLLLLTLAASFFFLREDQSDQSDQPDPSNPPAHSNRARNHRTSEPAFWDSAIVPDPGETPPVATIRPEDLGIKPPSTPVDPRALITKAIEEKNLPTIQTAALSWFQQDPTAARDWLAAQPDLAELQPAISYIAHHISENGDITNAINWANILTDPTARETTLFDIQALALRNGKLTPENIDPTGLSPERIAELQSGAAGD